MKGEIKNPTYLKVINRGYTPIRYYWKNGGWSYGWIYQEGRKWYQCYFPSRGHQKIRIGDSNLVRTDKIGRAGKTDGDFLRDS